jgi:DNA-binding beta-propeller fold protein YncE
MQRLWNRWMARVAAGTLLLMGVACSAPQQSASPASDSDNVGLEALTKSQALQRVLERTPPKPASGGTAPNFVSDPGWPKPLPNNWVIGDVGGLTVDSHDNIWVYHRPRSLTSTDAGALGEAGKNAKGQPISAIGHPRPYGQLSGCCVPAPSVLQFDKAGNLLQAWGGPADPGFLEKRCPAADGCYWPGREHGIFVDHNDFVWISGNGERARGTNSGEYPWAANFGGDDSQILKFKSDGTFVLAIGTQGMKTPNSNDTNGGVNGTPQPYLPADFTVDPKTNTMYVADGYGNRRVLVVDAATGKYIGHFGAYGQNPVVGESTDPAYGGAWAADFRRGEMKPKYFRSPLHCAELSKDGFLYLCDRGNNRIQVFKASEVGKPCQNPNGEAGKCGFVGELYVSPQTAGGTSGSLAFSTDAEQSCLYVADLTNFTIYEINRKTLQEIDRFGSGGKGLGQFHWPHKLSVDSEGNVYVGDVDGNGNVQKFLRYGATTCSGTGHAEVGSYRAAK